MIDHDALFKQLLSTFFVEFVELFFPKVGEYLDRRALEFLDKEFFTDIESDKRREADIVVKARFRNASAFFIINLENQGDIKNLLEFQQRLFFYAAHLHQKHKLPVYSIVVLYGEHPKRPLPDAYRIEFPDGVMLEFRYRVVQLNRLPWREFIKRKNPVASALMAKMNIALPERPFVKVECLKILTSLRIDKKRLRLLGTFVDTYLNLTAKEEKIFQAEIAKIEPRTKERVMEFTSSWERKGMEQGKREGLQQGKREGLQQGKREGALKVTLGLLDRKFGVVAARTRKRIKQLSLEQLEQLSLAVLDFSTLQDLSAWLDAADHKT
ncbi:MAG: DUF4351 domain-containing protein [Acidobacteria bacterium]|nr:DUF4351 domain-containing protein [Acidobacteriota bacterium]